MRFLAASILLCDCFTASSAMTCTRNSSDCNPPLGTVLWELLASGFLNPAEALQTEADRNRVFIMTVWFVGLPPFPRSNRAHVEYVRNDAAHDAAPARHPGPDMKAGKPIDHKRQLTAEGKRSDTKRGHGSMVHAERKSE